MSHLSSLNDPTNKCFPRRSAHYQDTSQGSQLNFLTISEESVYIENHLPNDTLKEINRRSSYNNLNPRKKSLSKSKTENHLRTSQSSVDIINSFPPENQIFKREDFEDILVKANIEFVDPSYCNKKSNLDSDDESFINQNNQFEIVEQTRKENDDQIYYLKLKHKHKSTSKCLIEQNMPKETQLDVDQIHLICSQNNLENDKRFNTENIQHFAHDQDDYFVRNCNDDDDQSSYEEERDISSNWYESFRPSLFSYVPPFILFKLYDSTKEIIFPPELQEHIIWKTSAITPLVIRKTLMISGFKFLKNDDISKGSNIWIGIWGKHIKAVNYRNLKPFQKLNHFPGTYQIGRKDRLWRNLSRLMIKFGKKEFGFMPRTFILPQDLKNLKSVWEKSSQRDNWIIKPPASARGIGIKLVNQWNQIPKRKSIIVQKYINRPFLINGSKFDLRIYVLVTSFHPMRIYIYEDGLVRFASVKYSSDTTSLGDRYMHLTNYSVNKLSSHYTANDNATACQGHKWTLSSLWRYLKKRNIDVNSLWESIKDLIVKTMISGENSITGLIKNNLKSRYSCYELFGVDVLLDSDLKPWLLEVNISPSLHSNSKLDFAVKGPMVRDLLNIAGYHMCQEPTDELNHQLNDWLNSHDKITNMALDKRLYNFFLSKEDKERQEKFQDMKRDAYLREILSDLSSDDVRHLIQAEDELTQSNGFIRLFPTSCTYLYHNFFEAPRYYNFLFDAWENKYENNRNEGVQLLQSLCDRRYHLHNYQGRDPRLRKRYVKSNHVLEDRKARLQIKRNKILSTSKLPKCNPKTSSIPNKGKLKNNLIFSRKSENIELDLIYLNNNKIDIINDRTKKEQNFNFPYDSNNNTRLFDESDIKKIKKFYYRNGYFPSEFLDFLNKMN